MEISHEFSLENAVCWHPLQTVEPDCKPGRFWIRKGLKSGSLKNQQQQQKKNPLKKSSMKCALKESWWDDWAMVSGDDKKLYERNWKGSKANLSLESERNLSAKTSGRQVVVRVNW